MTNLDLLKVLESIKSNLYDIGSCMRGKQYDLAEDLLKNLKKEVENKISSIKEHPETYADYMFGSSDFSMIKQKGFHSFFKDVDDQRIGIVFWLNSKGKLKNIEYINCNYDDLDSYIKSAIDYKSKELEGKKYDTL